MATTLSWLLGNIVWSCFSKQDMANSKIAYDGKYGEVANNCWFVCLGYEATIGWGVIWYPYIWYWWLVLFG